MNSFKRSAPTTSLLGFVPSIVIQDLQDNDFQQNQLPHRQQFKSVVMFADIAGFTNLTEELSKMGPEGAEIIAFAINRYMELLVAAIGRSGGDIFKFAGDAIIVVWPPPEASQLNLLCRQAVQSAFDIQSKLNDTYIIPNIKLSVKIGFGIGDLSVIYVGGVFRRSEYLPAGDPLTQAFHAEHLCQKGGETIVSKEVYATVKEFFNFNSILNDHNETFYKLISLGQETKVRMKADALLIRNHINPAQIELIKPRIMPFIPAALLPYIDIDEEKWSSELRYLTVVFVNLGIDLKDANQNDGLQRIQKVVETVQKCVYMHEGSLNKLLMDDKGSTLVLVFGLPPMSHQDDSVRAILACFMLREQLSISCSMGIATGTVFAGVIGTSGSRREYSVMGDIVNLSARLMQTACQESEQKILCDIQTAQDASNKLRMYFYKSVQMKGKEIKVPIYIPSREHKVYWYDAFPKIKPHLNHYTLQWLRQRDENENLPMEGEVDIWEHVGRVESIKQIQQQIDRYLKGKDKKGILLLAGGYGCGKSLLIKSVLTKINKKINLGNYSSWKYGERNGIYITQLNSMQKSQKLNGLRQVLQEVFALIASRRKREPNQEFLNEIVRQHDYAYKHYNQFLEIMGLRKKDLLKHFPVKPKEITQDAILFEQKQLKSMCLHLFGSYFEVVIDLFFLSFFFFKKKQQKAKKYKKQQSKQQPKPLQQQQQKNESIGDNINQQREKSNSLSRLDIQMNNLIAPVIICLEDVQYYDQLSFQVLASLIKNFERLFYICIVRDKENCWLDGLALLENTLESKYYTQIFLKPLTRNQDTNEFELMLQSVFGISEFRLEHVNYKEQTNHQSRRITTAQKPEQQDLKQIVMQQNENRILSDHLLFSSNKWDLYRKKLSHYVVHFLYLKTQGHALIAIQLIINIIAMGLIKIDKTQGIAYIGTEMRKMLMHEEIVTVQAPVCSIQMNGPVIDKLTCLESLIMKVASLIGDIFDIQTLNQINPFKDTINYEILSKILRDLDRRDFIEIMDIQENNIYYRFSGLNTREVLYQRMTYAQRRQLHKSVAEAIHTLPQQPDSDERKEQAKLEFHWTQTETKAEQKRRELNNKCKKYLFSLYFFFDQFNLRICSHTKLRRVLAKSNNNPTAEIRVGILDKKSDSNFTWANRFCVLNSGAFMYYYTREHYKNMRDDPLGFIPLKNIFNILSVNEKESANRQNVFTIYASNWIKKGKEMGKRDFYFCAQTESDLEEWTIFLEFSKAKAVYDEFIEDFGKIQFPIEQQLSQYDPSISMLVQSILNRSTKIQRQQSRTKQTQSISERKSRASRLVAKISRQGTQGQLDEQKEVYSQIQLQEINLLKERIRVFFYKSVLIYFSQLFEMSLQQDEKQYKTFGQTVKIIIQHNYLFHIDREQLQMNEKFDRLKQVYLFIDHYSKGRSMGKSVDLIESKRSLQQMTGIVEEKNHAEEHEHSLTPSQTRSQLIVSSVPKFPLLQAIQEVEDKNLEEASFSKKPILQFKKIEVDKNNEQRLLENPTDEDLISYSIFLAGLSNDFQQAQQGQHK